MLSALHTISTYPFDLGSPIFAHYPAMKFGHFQSVNYFADLLAPMALKALADVPEKDQGWVLTSPPLQGLPCGANLVCRAVCGQLAKALPDGHTPRLDSMEVRGPRIPFRNLADFAGYNDYSKYDLKKRQQFRLARNERAIYDLANFEGRRAIFVNDINVTGTQLATITKLLQSAGIKSLDMLLIVNVDRKIGRAFPQLENEINTSRITDLAEFTAFLRDCEFEPTGKLISRLMSHDPHEFGAIFEALRPPKRQMLHRAILQEGLYGGPLFKEKIEIVERALSGE
jgi:PRTase ComF-like